MNLGAKNRQASIGRRGGRAIWDASAAPGSGGGAEDADPTGTEASESARVARDSDDSARGGAAGGFGDGACEPPGGGAGGCAFSAAGGPSVAGGPLGAMI